MEKKPSIFLFFNIANTPHKCTIRHIAGLQVSSFLFTIHCFYRDENDLAPDDQHYLEKEHFVFGNILEER